MGIFSMVIVLLMTFVFGANGLNTDTIWADELTSVGHMGAFAPPFTPAQIVDSISEKSSQHMPLFFILGAGWVQLAGWSQLSLRLIGVLAGVLMIAWLYRLGSDVANRRAGVVAALLMGSSAFMIIYLHEIRMYSMFMMFAVMHTWLYWRLAHDYQVTWLTWLLFILTTSALFYTHIFSTVLFAGLGIYHLLFVGKSRKWLMIIIGWGAGAFLFLPYVPTVIKGFTLATNKVSTFTTSMSLSELMQSFVYLLTNGFPLLLIPLAVLFVYAMWRSRNRAVLHLLVVTLVMFTVLVVINERFGLVPQRRARYLLILWFPFLMLFAYGLTNIPRWKWVTAITVVIWGGAGWQLYRLPSFMDYIGTMVIVQHYPPLQDYVTALEGKTRPQDFIVGFSKANFVNHEDKHSKSVGDYYIETQLGIDGTFIASGLNQENTVLDVAEKVGNYPYLLFTHNPANKPGNFEQVLGIIQRDYQACDVVLDEPELFVQRYVHQLLTCDREYEPIVYGNGVTIVDKYATYDPESYTVRIVTGWEVAHEQLLYEYNVSLQLVTGDWQNVGQTDRHLHDDLLKWYVAELSTTDLPPDDYRVMVVVYHRDTGEKVIGTDLTTGETGTILPITVFTIEE